jgi:putative peptidoglycan lipid II flippase
MEEYDEALSVSLGLTLFISLPAAAGLIGLAGPVIGLLFERGAFTPEAVTATANALVAYSAGLPFIALSRPLVAGFYALEDTRTPVKIAVLCLVANIGLGLLLMRPLAHVGLALAVSASSLLNFLLLYVLLRRRRGTPLLPMGPAVRILLLSALIGGGAYLSAPWHPWWVLLIPAWIALYMFLALAMGLKEARLFADMIRSRVRRKLSRRA